MFFDRFWNGVWNVTNVAYNFLALKRKELLFCCFLVAMVWMFFSQLPAAVIDLLLSSQLFLALLFLLETIFHREYFSTKAPVAIVTIGLLQILVFFIVCKNLLLTGAVGTGSLILEKISFLALAGNVYVAGLIFGLLIFIVHIIIAKGAARIAEVSARFSLDSLPGKQLTIDSDLRNNLISPEIAVLRRQDLDANSKLYGSMDGIMKFAQGTVLFLMVVIPLSCLVGTFLGYNRGLKLFDSFTNYTLLFSALGNFNALIILIVGIIALEFVIQKDESATQVTATKCLVFDETTVILLGLLFVFLGLLPNTPTLAFLLIGSGALTLVYGRFYLVKRLKVRAGATLEARQKFQNLEFVFADEVLNIKLDTKLYAMFEKDKNKLENYWNKLIQQKILERGIPFPKWNIQLDTSLAEATFRIELKQNKILDLTESLFLSGYYIVLANNQTLAEDLNVQETLIEPLTKASCIFSALEVEQKIVLEKAEVKVLAPSYFLCHIIVGSYLDKLNYILGTEEIKKLVLANKNLYPSLIEELFNKNKISYPEFAELLKRLIREELDISNLKVILQLIIDFTLTEVVVEDRREWLNLLHKNLRLELVKGLLAQVVKDQEKQLIKGVVLSPALELEFRSTSSTLHMVRGVIPAFSPELVLELRQELKLVYDLALKNYGFPVVLVCSAEIRFAVQEFLFNQGYQKYIQVLAFDEFCQGYTFEAIAEVGNNHLLNT
ncbi:MAG: FHIPEP family type III secretion protein [Deltaproteobacteria bacterium]|jgi:type III secretion protein V|nr:FHIPEP family type III secretion protein [Deltaproteobacteria bacterium]